MQHISSANKNDRFLPNSPQAAAMSPTPSSISRSDHHCPQQAPSLLLPAPKKRRRPSTLSTSSSHSDPVVGHVTRGGKFKCLDAKCQDISFGRQADFRRHYDHTHVTKKVEYYCPVVGCQRSRKPAGKSKGRSFGTREDKMREHVRTVHESRKRRKITDAYDGGGSDVKYVPSDIEAL
jgi:hypothetical protein